MSSALPSLIYAYGGGRFGNQLLRFMHWIAWARSQSTPVEVIDLPFWPFASLFATWSAHPGCAYPLRSGWPDRIARLRPWLPEAVLYRGEWRARRCFAKTAPLLSRRVRVLDLCDGDQLDLENPSLLAQVQSAHRLICTGWRFAGWRLLERQATEIRKLFQPAAEFAQRTDAFIAPFRSRYDLLAGLFIRRGDYREWAAGRFCFPLESYARWASELVAIHPGRRVGIVLAGDELIPREIFSQLPVIYATGCVGEGGHWFESFLELAACDLIASPPSTFSACASFMGERPLWPLTGREQSLADTAPMTRHLFDAALHPEFSTAVQ